MASNRLEAIGEKIWIVDGPKVNFFSFPYPTRMVVIQLPQGSWLWSPVQFDESLYQEIEKVAGPIRYLVSPNKIHWLSLREWHERKPDAKMYASPGLAERQVTRDLQFDATLTENPEDEWKDYIDQVLFRGAVLDEVVFFHKPSQTCLVCDLIQRFPTDYDFGSSWKAWLMRLDGMVGDNGTAPGELRALIWISGNIPRARECKNKILHRWQPRQLVIAHGNNVLLPQSNAYEVIANSFRWIPDRASICETCCCCCCGGGDQSRTNDESKQD